MFVSVCIYYPLMAATEVNRFSILCLVLLLLPNHPTCTRTGTAVNLPTILLNRTLYGGSTPLQSLQSSTFVVPSPRLVVIHLCSTGFGHSNVPQMKWSKHGYTSMCVPGHDPPKDITVCMDISTNPGPSSDDPSTPSCRNQISRDYHLEPQSSSVFKSQSYTPISYAAGRRVYTRQQLLNLRSLAERPSSQVLHQLNINCLSRRYRGKRGGVKRNPKYPIPVHISERNLHKKFDIHQAWEKGQAYLGQNDTNFSNCGVRLANLVNIPRGQTIRRPCMPRFMLCNPRSLVNKFDEFRSFLHNHNIQIACVSETWFKHDTPNEQVSVEGFSLFSKERSNRPGGGVALYVNDSLQAVGYETFIPQQLEVVWVKLRPPLLPRSITCLYYCAIYSPPNDPNADLLISHLVETIDTLNTNYPDAGIVIAGDMNHLDTSELTTGQFTQVVDSPTRGSATLDKIITNISSQYLSPVIMAPLQRSDHNTILWNPKVNSIQRNETYTKTTRPIRQSSVRYFGQWITQYDWPDLYSAPNSQSKCSVFYDTLNKSINKYFPPKTIKLHIKDKPWMTGEIKALIKSRQMLFSDGNIRWKSVRNKIIRLVASAKKHYYHDRVQKLKQSNPAGWYRTIKLMTSSTTPNPTIIPPPGINSNNDLEIANCINTHFTSIGKDLSPIDLSSLPSYLPSPGPCPTVQEWEVYSQLKKISCRKAGGPDGIPASILREFAYELSKPLAHILNSSYSEGIVPNEWKRAIVIPIPKSYPPTWNKLRPISLTDHFAKVAEHFVVQWIISDIQENLDPNQFGNRKGVSTTHYLVKLVNHLAAHADLPKSHSSLVVTDFTKAFDHIDHNIVIRDLLRLGTRPSVIPWVCNFLTERSQCVRYKNSLSDFNVLNGGLPQGTKFGPLAFLAKFNSAVRLDNIAKNNGKLLSIKYVDDMTIVESSRGNDPHTIQSVLDQFSQWAVLNNMKLNPDKCATMTVCFMKNIPQFPHYRFPLLKSIQLIVSKFLGF